MTKIERKYLVETYEKELALWERYDLVKPNSEEKGEVLKEIFFNGTELFCKFNEADNKLAHALIHIMSEMAQVKLSVSRFLKVCEVCGVEVVESLEDKKG